MKKHTYLILLITCWIILFISLGVKLLFNHYFEISVNNQTIIELGNYIDSIPVLKYIIVTILYIPGTYIFYLSVCKEEFFYDWWILLVSCLIPTTKSYLPFVGFVLEILLVVVLPLIRKHLTNWLRVLVGVALLMVYELLMLFLRNLGFYLGGDNIIIGEIMNIDYYIIVIIFYLYSNYSKLNVLEEVS